MDSRRPLIVGIAVIVWSSAAQAQDARVLSTARELAEQGLAAYDAGRYEDAIPKLLQAYGAVKLPTLALNAARALAKAGRLVAATELCWQAQRLEPNDLWSEKKQEAAQEDCAREREEWLSLVARLKVEVAGADPKHLQVALDGAEMPIALLGAEQLVDPGSHHLEARTEARVVSEDIRLIQGEHGQVALKFAPLPPPHADRPQHTWTKTLGWVGVGIGAAGVTLGALTGALALHQRSRLRSDGCSGDVCHDPNQRDRIDTLNSMIDVSTVSFIAGGIMGAAGVTLLLWPQRSETPTPVSVTLGPRALNLQGSF